jgi:hypothetical protein
MFGPFVGPRSTNERMFGGVGGGVGFVESWSSASWTIFSPWLRVTLSR